MCIKNFLALVALLLASGCALTVTRQSATMPDGTQRETSFKGITFFDSKSSLAKATTTNTEKGQGVSIAGLTQESSGSNVVTLVDVAVKAAVTAAVKSVAPIPTP